MNRTKTCCCCNYRRLIKPKLLYHEKIGMERLPTRILLLRRYRKQYNLISSFVKYSMLSSEKSLQRDSSENVSKRPQLGYLGITYSYIY